jgi:hypothetical protein
MLKKLINLLKSKHTPNLKKLYNIIAKNNEIFYTDFNIKSNEITTEFINTYNNNILVVFKCKFEKVQLNYALVYFDDKANANYVNIGLTYNSCDGEYRSRFLTFNQLFKNIPKLVVDVLDDIEKIIKKKEKKINTEYIIYGDIVNDKIRSRIIDFIEEKKLIIKLLSIQLLYLMLIVIIKFKEININNDYLKLLELFGLNDFSFHFSDDVSLFFVKINILDFSALGYNIKEKFENSIKIGQKTILLTQSDVIDNEEMLLSWNELIIDTLVNNLIDDGNCGNFSFLYKIQLFKGANKKLFENKNILTIYELQDKIKNINEHLNNINKEIIKVGDILINERLTLIYYYSNLMKKYISDKLLYSDSCVIELKKHVGLTLFSILDSEYFKLSSPENMHPFQTNYINNPHNDDKITYKKYIFDVVYALLCLNYKLGIIHSDLHLNNLTVKSLTTSYVLEEALKLHERGSRYLTIYKIKSKMFFLLSNLSSLFIIDFSRNIINEDFIKRHIKKKTDNVMNAQKKKIKTFWKKEFNELYKIYECKIKRLLMENYDYIFKITTIMDTYKFLLNLNGIFINNYPWLSVIELIKNIIIFIRKRINDMFESEDPKQEINLESWPNYEILDKFFYVDEETRVKNILSSQKYVNEIKIVNYFELN